MKKIILLLAIFSFWIMGFAQNKTKTATISVDNSYADLTFGASDTINESQYYKITITSPQNFETMQDVYIDIDSVSGTPNVTIGLYGRLTTSSDSTLIGTAVTWGGTTDTTFTISNTSPNRYRIYYLWFSSTATDQQSKISDVQFKQWYSGGSVSGASITDGTATLTGGALSGVTTLTLENGLTVDNAANNVLEINENSDELKATFGSNTVTISSTDVTLFDFGTINVGTDDLDLSEGNIGNVGVISADSIKPDGTKITIATGTAVNNVAQIMVYEADDANYSNVLSATAGNTPATVLGSTDGTTAISSSDWTVSTTGVMAGIGDIGSNGSLILSGATSGGITITPLATGTGVATIQNQNVATSTITLPSATCTLPGLGLANTWTANQTLTGTSYIELDGAVSGGIKLLPLATGTALTTISNQNVAAATITLPSATTTLPGLTLNNVFTGTNQMYDDKVFTIGTTTTNAETKITAEFDETTTGIGILNIGDLSNPQVLNVNPGATVVPFAVNINHSAGAGNCGDLIAAYEKINVIGDGDADMTIVGTASRAYVGLTGGANNSVASQAYGAQPWAKHEGTGAITAMSGLSAKLDVSADNFTATTVNAGHFHIEGASTVTGQFDGVMVEVYPDVTSMDNAIKVAVDAGAVVQNGLAFSGSYAVAEIAGTNSETWSNGTNGVWDAGAANIRSATYNFADATAVGGTADAITIDFVPNLAALVAGLTVTFVAEAANTGAATLAIDGGTAKAINEAADNSAIEANDIRSGSVVTLVYDGTQWQQTSQSGN